MYVAWPPVTSSFHFKPFSTIRPLLMAQNERLYKPAGLKRYLPIEEDVNHHEVLLSSAQGLSYSSSAYVQQTNTRLACPNERTQVPTVPTCA